MTNPSRAKVERALISTVRYMTKAELTLEESADLLLRAAFDVYAEALGPVAARRWAYRCLVELARDGEEDAPRFFTSRGSA